MVQVRREMSKWSDRALTEGTKFVYREWRARVGDGLSSGLDSNGSRLTCLHEMNGLEVARPVCWAWYGRCRDVLIGEDGTGDAWTVS
jgi:hypothetical protein